MPELYDRQQCALMKYTEEILQAYADRFNFFSRGAFRGMAKRQE